MRNVMTKTLGDEYETTQLNPAYADSEDGKASHEKIKKLVGDIPEQSSLKMRMAVLEAVIDEVIEDVVAVNDGVVSEERIQEEISPVIEKAMVLHLVPSSIKQRIPYLIAAHLKRYDPKIALQEKAARFLTGSMIKMSEEDTVVSEVLDDKAADTGYDITEEVVEHKGDSISVDGSVPTVVEDSMRFLAASTVNQRKATVLVSRYVSGPILEDTLNKLKNHLPESFKKKYNL